MGIEGMTEIRCPMCGKENPPELEVCEFCGARLKPMDLSSQGAGEPEGRPKDSGDEPRESTPDWLARIRAQAEDESDREPETQSREDEPESPPQERGGTGGLLDRLGSYQPEEAPGPAAESRGRDLPEATMPESRDRADRDWRDQLEGAAAETGEAGLEGASREVPDWLKSFAEDSEGLEAEEVPPWLARIRAQQRRALQAEEEEAKEAAAGADEDWWEQAMQAEEGPSHDPEEPTPISPEPPDVPFEDTGALERDLAETADSPAFEFPESDLPREQVEGMPGAEPAQFPEAEEADLLPDEPAKPEETPAPEIEVGPFAESPPVEPMIPEGIQEEEPQEELPSTPPLILEGDESDEEEEIEDIDLGSIDLPQWLGELQDIQDSELEEEGAGQVDLEPAKLPSWLEAKRPLETIRPTAEVEPEEGQVVETSGPLAGLRGALSAEPIVAMPRHPTIGGKSLDISERQYARAEILQRMISEESEEVEATRRRRVAVPILRWIVSALLFFAVLVPVLYKGQIFAIPTRWPQELAPLVTMVEALPNDRPMLFVVDYDPGSAGEMERLAGPLLDHAILRGMPVVTLSSRPSGPALSEHLLSALNVPERLDHGDGYYDLGYLAGGQTGVHLFAASPRQAALRGFRPSGEESAASPWSTQILSDVEKLSDFAAVVVLSSGTESARNWVEQTGSRLGTRPLVMVLTTGISPVVRPYYEAQQPQVDGFLAGLRSAVTYEQVLGGSGMASRLWDAYGGGMWVAIGALSVGVAYGVAALALEGRRRGLGNA